MKHSGKDATRTVRPPSRSPERSPYGRATITRRLNGGQLQVLEKVMTRDVRVPFSEDEPEMRDAWQCIPVRPTADDGWFIFDDSGDYKTEWGRWHDVDGSA